MATVPAIVGFVVVLAERRIMGFMQARLGPNRVGPEGTLQGVADLVKLVTKEDITPARAEKAVYFLAPILAVIPALTALAVIPFGPPVKIGKVMVPLWVADINIGLLFLLAITSIGVYGIILGGWSSNNKYSLLGGLRSAAQLVSYEVPMGLALVVGAPHDAFPVAARDRAPPGGHAPLVRLPGAGRLLHLFRVGDRGDQPQSLRPARRPSRSWSPASTPSTRASSSRSSSWASTRP